MDYCYENDKLKTREILLVKTSEFDDKNCFQILKTGFEITGSEKKNSKKFISHKCFFDVVTYEWNDEIYQLKKSTYLVYLIFCLILSPIALVFYIPFHVSLRFPLMLSIIKMLFALF